MEEVSRRVLAPSKAGSQLQTHWYYERARGQHLNDQSGLTTAKRKQFLLISPRNQVITKTDLAKVECCFSRLPDVACKGAEKAFIAFADHVAKEWTDEGKRTGYGDDWFKAAVAKVIIFRAAERIVSAAPWYQQGYRSQIVAYTCARLAQLADEYRDSAGINFARIWSQQSTDQLLEQQLDLIGEAMARVLLDPPIPGQNIGEWAKQQACRKAALETPVDMVRGFKAWTISREERRANERDRRTTGEIDEGLNALQEVLSNDSAYWQGLRRFCQAKRILLPEDEKALVPACQLPRMVPTDRQAARLLQLVTRAEEAGWQTK